MFPKSVDGYKWAQEVEIKSSSKPKYKKNCSPIGVGLVEDEATLWKIFFREYQIFLKN
jgi:hypothetical protein